MNHVYELSSVALPRPSVVTIGAFDGVHRGHQALIHRLVDDAHAQERLAVVLTFFPHPDVAIRGIEGRYYLTDPETRARHLLDLGVDYVVTHPFNDEVRQIKAADFVDQLINSLNLSELWVGADFAMGYKREGNIAFLKAQGQQKGFSVNVVDMVHTEAAGMTISSTLIRQGLAEGRVEQVRDWLGRSYAVSGVVVEGQKRGRQLGFPTANMDVWDKQILPMNGIYASWALVGGERFKAMTNIGVSPTFGGKVVTVEPYLLDFDREIYGEMITVTFEKFMRAEKKFDGLDALVKQIQRDVDEGREFLVAQEQP